MSLVLHPKPSANQYTEHPLWPCAPQQIYWFALRRGKYKQMKPDADGVYRSKVFPGLWLDPEALLAGDRKRLLAVLREGLASPEHGAFVEKLKRSK
jgi:hypothetical protein